MRRPLLACLVTLAACGAGNDVTLSASDARVHFRAQPFLLDVSGSDGARVLSATRLLATLDKPDYDALRPLPGWDAYEAHLQPFTAASSGRMLQATKNSAKAVFKLGQKESLSVDVTVSDGRVHVDLVVSDTAYNITALELLAGPSEHYFGMGERFASVDHRGLALYSWAEEGGLGAGENVVVARGSYPLPNGASMTYFPVPFFHSTAGYALLANTTRRTEIHLASDAPDRALVQVNGNALPIVVYTRKDPLRRLDDYTADTGRPMVPAPWVYGVRMRSGSGAVVEGVPEYQLMRQRSLPVTAIDDSVHFLPDDSEQGREAELTAFNQSAHALGYKVVNYNTPYVATGDARAQPDYDYGVQNGLFQMSPSGAPATTVFLSGQLHTLSSIDLVNPAGATWYQTLLSRSLAVGYDGWMNDFGEYTARDSIMSDGRKGDEVHNLFPVLSAMAAHALLEQQKPNDYWFFVRSGYIGTQQYAPEVWGGDSEASFDDTQGLPSAVRAGLNLAMVGVWQYASDGTGFKCITGGPYDKEVYVRWLEFCAVSPLFHEENACANPLASQHKWNLWNDDETQDAWRETASLHTRLAPYLRALAKAANATGAPIMRHPFLAFPDEPDGWAVEDSYFFGPSLYAAPVVRRGVSTRHVWLPPGRYVEWTEKTVHTGPGFVDVPAPLLRLPLFVVEGTLVPLLDADVQTLAPATDPSVVTEAARAGVLDVIAALGPSGTARFTLDDGTAISVARTATMAPPAPMSQPSDSIGDVSRAQFSTESASAVALDHEDLHAEVSGPVARSVRFEVWRLP